MIYDATTMRLPLALSADVCVIGAGAGGAMAAMVAAEAKKRVVVIEPGAFLTPADMCQREDAMIPALYADAGARTSSNRGVKILQGKGVGGSTLHNLNLCKRIPSALHERWQKERGLETLDALTLDGLYSEVEALLAVSPVPRAAWNDHNRLLEAGCRALGWRGGGLRHNRTGCLGSGFCELGCAYDAKNNAAKILVPRAVDAAAVFITRCQAVAIEHANGRVAAVEAIAIDAKGESAGRVRIEAPRICVSASATGTPALLARSRIPDPSGSTGRTLRLHPSVVAAGEFAEPVNAWRGIPQTYECTEHLSFDEAGHRSWIVPAFAHPIGTATLLPGLGAEHAALMRHYDRIAVFTAMLHDRSQGTVRADGKTGVTVDYWPDAADQAELRFGLAACARLLFAAGAQRVIVPTFPLRVLHRPEDLAELERIPFEPGAIDLTAVHPMGSVAMGDDPKSAAVDSEGKHHHVEGLWIADASLFPSSIGVPPQLSVFALALVVGRSSAAH